MVEKSQALEIISGNPWVGIILSPDGHIAEVVPFSAEPTAETFLDFTQTHARGRRFRLVRQGHVTEGQLDALIADIIRPSRVSGSRESYGPTVPEWESSLHPLSAERCIADAMAEFLSRRSG